MAFDQTTRNRLASFVGETRKLLTDEFTRQLQHEYGLDPATAEVTALEKLGHLDDARRETAVLLRETLEHYLAGEGASGNKARREVLDRIVREQAFTVLNRLCALRLAEARGVLIESVGKRYQSKGFQLYSRLAGSALGETGDAYRTYLFSIFDELAVDMPVLFDRFSPEGRLFPREATLLAVLAEIDQPEIEPLWAEDETIGWIYQYFNSKEERKAMRDASAAPRNSRELAVRNQFFTPRYVVEFLTDNTLGRIWYEMTRGETALKDQCRYLVRRPTEIFLQPGEAAPEEAAHEDLSQEELLHQPVYVPHRPLKDPRDVKMLDPACGSMHFGLYAFDLFERIYEEAWEIEEAHGADALLRSEGLSPLSETYPDRGAFLREIPRLVIERNIHGIDIDPRAVQIAGLSLWLRAQRSWHNQGAKPQDRPRIDRSNVVCAEPMPGEDTFLEEFIATHLSATPEDRLLGQLVRRVFDAMKLAGEAGSLLKIDDEVAGAVAEAKERWTATTRQEQGRLPLGEKIALDVSGINEHGFWEDAEERIYRALRSYAIQADNGGGSYQRKLFSSDAERGFAFIDVCRKRYDAVLMNPPFGLPSTASRNLLIDSFPNTWKDVYAAFADRGLQVLVRNGMLGAITPSMWQYSRQLRDFRHDLLDRGSPRLLAEVGGGVMDDATVEASIWTAGKAKSRDPLLSLDLLDASREERPAAILRPGAEWRHLLPGRFERIAESPYCHHLSPALLDLWERPARLAQVAEIAKGNTTFDDFRFLRLWSEVPVAGSSRWVVYRSGGDFQPYFAASSLRIDWRNHGAEVRAWGTAKHGSDAQVMQSSKYWYCPGLGYPRVGTLGFGVRVAQRGEVFSGSSIFILPQSEEAAWLLLALLNSGPSLALFEAHGRHRRTETIALKDLPVVPEDLLPEQTDLERNARQAVAEVQNWESEDEANPTFRGISDPERFSEGEMRAREVHERVLRLSEDNSRLVQRALGLSGVALPPPDAHHWRPSLPAGEGAARAIGYVAGCAFGRWDVRVATGERPMPELPDPFAPLPICPPSQLQSESALPLTREDAARLQTEGLWEYPIEIPWDGVLVDDPGHTQDVEARVQQVLQVVWRNRWESIEREACNLLHVGTLRDYFRKPSDFFTDHLKRYSKSRRQAPIYWPLSTPSGSYTLWIYYHRLTDQTLYTCVNDFVEPKLKQVAEDAARLRMRLGRSSTEEKELERLTLLEAELRDFRDELLRIAKFWKPNLNDGVQITAAPLWRLFQLKPWQKKLRETWEALEEGEYDWAHLAYSIWPERVSEKCRRDKSLAIAHGLEELYEEPKGQAVKKRGRRKAAEEELDELDLEA